ncbi:MAG TPA: tetratricopeptide repeat protein, partial [Candidatus Polarisedimenticolia bacterium]|nr:tetratricopeptide repeat protein [Candidatus Polarisedimenticolia bacterium]
MNTTTPSGSAAPIPLRYPPILLLLFVAGMCCLANASSTPGAAPGKPSRESSKNEKSGTDSQADLSVIRRLLNQGQFGPAEQKARDLLVRTELADGADSLATARVLDLLAESLVDAAKVRDPEAGSLIERALRIKQTRLGPDDPELAATLTISGKLRFGTGDYKGARDLCAKAMTLREKALPPDHPDLAATLECLGKARCQLGDFDGARVAFERARKIQEASLGSDDPMLARALNNLAIIYSIQGEYEKSVPLLQQSIEIRERKLGSEDASLGAPINNLGKLYMMAGDFAAAGRFLERALKLRVKSLGPEHYEVGLTLHNLAILHAALADYSRAEEYYRRALEILEKSVGPYHGEVGGTLQDQGAMLVQEGKLAEAIPLLTRSIAINEKANRLDHEETLLARIRLADAHRDLGHLDQARLLYEKALALQDKILGPEHPDRATGLHEFGSFLLTTGEFSKARDSLRQALAIRKKIYGSDGPEVAETHRRLAAAEWGLGHPHTAFEEALRGEASIRRHLLKTSPALSERQALLYETRLGRGIAMAASILDSQPRPARDSETLSSLWEEVVRSRAVVLDEMARRHRNVLALDDARTAELSGDLARARSLLSRHALAGLDRVHPDRYRAELDRRQAEVERLERELAGRSQSYRNEEASRLAGFEDSFKGLPPGGVLVAYLRFDRLPVPARGGPSGPGGIRRGIPWYAVLTMKAGNTGPDLTMLGPAAKIDDLVASWRREVTHPGSGPRTDSAYRAVAAELTRRVWEPIASRLEGAQLAFLVPDGSLSLLNFGTLPLSGDRYLIEGETKLHYLSAERDLLRPARPGPGRGGAALVLGGPDFDRPAIEVSTQAHAAETTENPSTPAISPSVYRGSVSTCESFRTLRFDPLPGAMAEADEVSILLARHQDDSSRPSAILKL